MKNKNYMAMPVAVFLLVIFISFCSSKPNKNVEMNKNVVVPSDSLVTTPRIDFQDPQTVEVVESTGPVYMHLFMAYQKHWSDVEHIDDYDSPTYPMILWRLEAGSLKMVDTLNFNYANETALHGLYHFTDQKWFYFHERPLGNYRNYLKYPGKTPDFYSVLDYGGDSIIVRRADQSYINDRGDNTSLNWYLKKGEKYLLYNERKKTGKLIQFFAIDKFFNRREIFPDDEFQHPVTAGRAGFQDVSLPHYTFSKNNGELVISFDLGNESVADNPKAWIQLPIEERLQRAALTLWIVRPSWRYLVAKPRFYDRTKNDSLQNTVLIHDYMEDTWEYIKLPGDYTMVSSYGDWLCGMKRIFWDRGSEAERDSFNLLASRHGRKYTGKYGEIPQRFQGFTGMHYLFHIPTKKLTEWDAGDRDSEILTIKDGQLYFRVYDEIRKVPLDEQRKEIVWEKTEIVAKNKDIIPYVHHLFWAKQSPVVEEWITPKPEGRQ